MSNPELAEIAAAVATALELRPSPDYSTCWAEWMEKEQMWEFLMRDGSGVFGPHWQARCRDWLLERGYIGQENSKWAKWHNEYVSDDFKFDWHGPAAEFPARAIHALMKAQP